LAFGREITIPFEDFHVVLYPSYSSAVGFVEKERFVKLDEY
jgi:hypothetical protein